MFIDQTKAPYVIAEAGVNHGGDFVKASEMVHAAYEAGAGAIKFQAYKAELIAASISPAYWNTDYEKCTSQRELFSKYDGLAIDHYQQLQELATSLGIHFSLSIFDIQNLERLAPLCDFLKIASADITNIPLLRACAQLQKPLVISTGAASTTEVGSAVEVIKQRHSGWLALLHCVLNYPCSVSDANLARIGRLRERFLGQVDAFGYSDHTIPGSGKIDPCVASIVAGASVIETHFTLSPNLEGNDHYHSYGPDGLRKMISDAAEAVSLLGDGGDQLDTQSDARIYARRGLYYTADLERGAIVKSTDLIALRPIKFVEASEYDSIVGQVIISDVTEGAPVKFEDFVKDQNDLGS